MWARIVPPVLPADALLLSRAGGRAAASVTAGGPVLPTADAG